MFHSGGEAPRTASWGILSRPDGMLLVGSWPDPGLRSLATESRTSVLIISSHVDTSIAHPPSSSAKPRDLRFLHRQRMLGAPLPRFPAEARGVDTLHGPSLRKGFLVGQQDSQITQVVVRGAGDQGVPSAVKSGRRRNGKGQRRHRIPEPVPGLRSSDRRWRRGVTDAINSIAAGAQHDYR